MFVLLLSIMILLAGCGANPVIPDPDPEPEPGPDPVSTHTELRWISSLRADAPSSFLDVASDSSGKAYVAGTIHGSRGIIPGAGTFGSRAFVGENYLLMKFTASGDVEWSRKSVSSGRSTFEAVAVDAAGNVYALGHAFGDYTECTVSFSESASIIVPVLVVKPYLVKYSSEGELLWARTVDSGSYSCHFNELCLSGSGDVYVAGQILGSGPYVFDDDTSLYHGLGGRHALVVKYDAQGEACWARTVLSSQVESCFSGIAVDASGAIHAAGNIEGTGTCVFAEGFSSYFGTHPGFNIVSVIYDSDGRVLSVKPRALENGFSSSWKSMYTDVCATSDGRAALVGNVSGTCEYVVDEGRTLHGDSFAQNGLLTIYGSDGTYSGGVCGGFGPDASTTFYGVACGSMGAFYIVGDIDPFVGITEQPQDRYGIIAKADREGKPVYVDLFSAGEDIAFSSACVDPSGDLFVTGNYSMGYWGSFLLKISDRELAGTKAPSAVGSAWRNAKRISIE